MKKKTNIFDKLDNVLGNFQEEKATVDDVIRVATEVNEYLLSNPHPDDCISKEGPQRNRRMRITPDNIQELEHNQIFVFGSNESGIHGAGAARLARKKFGAVNGVSEGLRGQSYAIPTKDRSIKKTLSANKIRLHIETFIRFAKIRPALKFMVTEVGCGLAGLRPEDVAPLFEEAMELKNVWLPEKFINHLSK